MKDELRTDGDSIAWRIWSTAQNQLFFFCVDAAWLNEGRYPGGRPSVCEN